MLRRSRRPVLLKNSGKPKIKIHNDNQISTIKNNTIYNIDINDNINNFFLNSNYQNNIKSKNSRIPKIMTFFWSGKEMSWMRYMTIYSFSKLNPDWSIHLISDNNYNNKNKNWNEHTVQDFNLNIKNNYFNEIKKIKNVKIFNWNTTHCSQIKNINWNNIYPFHKCDFIEWETLYYKGGFFSDFDILYIKPMDELYNTLAKENINTGLVYQQIKEMNNNFFSIGFLCSSVGNLFFKDLFLHTFKIFNDKYYQSTGVNSIYSLLSNKKIQTSRNINFLNIIQKKYPSDKIYNFPMKLVYPWDWLHLDQIFSYNQISKIPTETIGIHWYGGDPISQMFNITLNHNNFIEFDNTFCNAILKYL